MDDKPKIEISVLKGFKLFNQNTPFVIKCRFNMYYRYIRFNGWRKIVSSERIFKNQKQNYIMI